VNSTALIYAALLLLSGFVAAIIAIHTWLRKQAAGAKSLLFMMIAMIVWSWAYALHWISPIWPAPFFWLDATYLGVVAIPMLVLSFSMRMTHQDRLFSRQLMGILSIEPILTLVLLWTDPLHHLFYGSSRLAESNSIFNGGPWFWINVLYSYTLIAFSFYLLVRAFVKSRGEIYRKQLGVCLTGLTIPIAVNITGLLGYDPLPGLDLTPFLFTIEGLFFLDQFGVFPHV
jgi:hypothetical protein